MTSIFGKFKDENFRYKYMNIILVYVFLIIFILTIGILNRHFFTARNVSNLTFTGFPLIMVAFGQTLVIMTKGVDVSLGAIVSLTNCICVVLMRPNDRYGWVLGVVVAIMVGAACGLVNGILIAHFRLAAMIVTIAMFTVYTGLALAVLPMPGGTVHSAFANAMRMKFGDIAGITFFIILVLIIMRIITNRTPFGKRLRAVGGNETASYATGIKTERTKIMAYVIAGILSSFGGIFLSGYMYSGDPTIGNNYALRAVASSIIGGAAFSGAVGDMLGTVAGVIILTLITNMLNLFGISSYYQFLVQGIIIIAALALGSLRKSS